MAENLLTPEFRTSFVNVFRPQKMNKDDADKKPKYGITPLFPHPSKMAPAYKKEYDDFLARAKKALSDAAFAKWGDKAKTMKLKTPFRDQGEKDYDGYEEGALFFNATSTQKPGLIDADNNDIIEEKDFYSGCYARCTLRAYAYGGPGTPYSPGVALGLQNIQKLRDGEPLGGNRVKAQDEFAPVTGAGDAGEAGSVDSLFD